MLLSSEPELWAKIWWKCLNGLYGFLTFSSYSKLDVHWKELTASNKQNAQKQGSISLISWKYEGPIYCMLPFQIIYFLPPEPFSLGLPDINGVLRHICYPLGHFFSISSIKHNPHS